MFDVKHSRHSRLWLAPLLAAVLAVSAAAGAGPPTFEKDVNLDVARRVAASLTRAGVPVILTRTADVHVRPADRSGVANHRRVDAFVSIHHNSSRSPDADWSEIYHQRMSPSSKTLGSEVAGALAHGLGQKARLLTRRGERGDYYWQLRETRMPAVLVESAFLSNPRQARLLASAWYRQAIADAIAEGILAYQRTIVARPLPGRIQPVRVTAQTLAPPEAIRGSAVNAQTVRLTWATDPLTPGYRVYRDGILIGETANGVGNLEPGRVAFEDLWAAPGQRYGYEIVGTIPGTGPGSLESVPARVGVRTPPIVVALDPGHGGRDPGAVARP